MMSKLFLALLFITGVNGADLKQGDYCGVQGQDFLNYNFTGDVAVAGDGCTSENNTNCLCGPVFEDGKSLGAWYWQCNNAVKEGPVDGKTCPNTVPVIKSQGVDQIDFTESSLGIVNPCNTSIHPTGRPGDEACYYSECENGGQYSAICGCVDLSQRDPTNTDGMHWICLHATCACGLPDTPAPVASAPVAAPVSTSAARGTPFVLAVVVSSVAFMIAGL